MHTSVQLLAHCDVLLLIAEVSWCTDFTVALAHSCRVVYRIATIIMVESNPVTFDASTQTRRVAVCDLPFQCPFGPLQFLPPRRILISTLSLCCGSNTVAHDCDSMSIVSAATSELESLIEDGIIQDVFDALDAADGATVYGADQGG